MRFFSYTALLLLAMVSSCSSKKTKPENELLSNDFESLEGWDVDNPSLTREKAHSGQYSIKIQKDIAYSLTYKNIMAKMSPMKVTKVRVSGYVYTTKPTGASLTVQLVRSATDGTSVFNQSINLNSAVTKPGEWVKVSQEFTLPADAAPSNQFRVYTWGASGDEVVYLDDLQVTRE